MPLDIVTELLAGTLPRVVQLRREAPQILTACRSGHFEYGCWGHYNYLQSAYLLAWLYRFEHPSNPLYRDSWCAETAAEFTDQLHPLLQAGKAKHQNPITAEWNPLAALETMDLLQPEPARRAVWLEFIEDYIQFALARPFGFTSPNHEAWRVLFLHRAATILARPDLANRAQFYLQQLLTYQTQEGFWEEGVHHGPSMTYNVLMLEPLAWIYRLTGDRAVQRATERLANFMADWSLPDGCMVGAFDGRQSTGFGFGVPAVPGLELTPRGRTLSERSLRFKRRSDWLGEGLRGSVWYDHFSLMFLGTALRYHAEFVPPGERAGAAEATTPLWMDRDGVAENQTTEFAALMFRRGPWCGALAGQNSQVVRQQADIYRLERASRIELWHADAHLVLGGGHNRLDWPAPYTNVVIDTGFAGDTQFGWLEAAQHGARRSYYLPHQCELRRLSDGIELTQIFAHATVRFQLTTVDDHRARIRAEWSQQGVKRMCLQLPLAVWRGARLLADGQLAAETSTHLPTPVPLRTGLSVEGGPFGASVALTVPAGVPAGLRWPLDTLKNYFEQTQIVEDRKPLFRLAWVTSQWIEPPATGAAEWLLQVASTPAGKTSPR